MGWELNEADANRDFEFFKALIKEGLINPPRLLWGQKATFLEIILDGAWSQKSIKQLYDFCEKHGYEAVLSSGTWDKQPKFVISSVEKDGGSK